MVKTRLTPLLTSSEAAELYSCMLHDILDLVRSLPGVSPIIYFQDDPGAAGFFREIAPDIVSFPQSGADLGERMAAAFLELFARGCSPVAIIGTDAPDLPDEHILQAFRELENNRIDAVFGPARDGGYYLLAMKRYWPELFRDIPWSTGAVFEASIARAEAAGIRTFILPRWYDIDTCADLARPELLHGTGGGRFTKEFLKAHFSGP